PYISFLEVLAMDGAKIVPHNAVEAMGDEGFAKAPIGTGPFRLAEWNAQHLVLKAYPEHFGGCPSIETLDIAFFRPEEPDLGASRFDRGEIDVFEAPAARLAKLAADDSVHIHQYQDLTLSFLGLCATQPPLDDVRIRQAIAQAIDRERIARD